MPQHGPVLLASTAASTAPAATQLDGIAGWAVGVMDRLGAPGAGVVVALENLFPPIPSEVVLPLAGLTASRGGFTLVEAIAWTTAGSLVGALLLYWLGAVIGRERVRAAAVRLPLVNPRDVDVAERWFLRHGPKAVFFGRMLPIVRSAISVPAGVERMRLPRFVLYTLAGSLIWNSAFVLAGYQLGESWILVERYAEVLQYLVVAAVVLACGWFVVTRLRARRRAGLDRPSRRRAGSRS
jgi:membrane protein DedA with SNARE-associated domain